MNILENKEYLFQILKIKNWKWSLFPRPYGKLVAFHPYIYTPAELHSLLMSDHNSADIQCSYIHAQEHMLRQKELGLFTWLFKYLFSKNFRIQEELGAIQQEMKFIKKNNVDFDIYEKARKLSSGWYFNMLSFEEAKDLLLSIWKEC